MKKKCQFSFAPNYVLSNTSKPLHHSSKTRASCVRGGGGEFAAARPYATCIILQLVCFFSLHVYIFYENVTECVLSVIFLHMVYCNEYYKYWKEK